MSKLVVSLYPDFATVQQAVRDILTEGFTRLDISLVANDAGGRFRAFAAGEDRPVQGSEIHTSAGVGTLEGGTGGIFSDFICLDLPGIGPAAAAGQIAERFRQVEDSEGKDLYRGLLEALIELGIPEVPAHYYAEGIRRGGCLIALYSADHLTGHLREIMNRHKPVDIYTRAEEWSKQGWSGFEPDALPLNQEEIEAERRQADAMSAGEKISAGEAGFQQHYETTYSDTPHEFGYYQAAYNMGYNLASDLRFRDRDWEAIAHVVESAWEEKRPGTLEEVRQALRRGWEAGRADKDSQG